MFHCDAVQALGKLDISDLMQFADAISISAHKIGGPQGVGAIIFNKSFPLQSLLKGGGQERRWRGGTENTIGVAGFGVALQAALEDDVDTVIKLRDQLETKILQYTTSAKVFGVNSERLPNTSNLMMPNVHSETQVMNFDLAGIAVSAGAACSSGKVQTSHVLTAMAIDPLESQCSLRVSIGWKTTIADIDAFVAEWKNIYDRCQKVDSRSIK
jgi:cysteine desulfurase